jgi:hypothetical protein
MTEGSRSLAAKAMVYLYAVWLPPQADVQNVRRS